MKPVRFHPEAREELLSTIDWYDARGEGVGARFLATVEKIVASIQSAPKAWQVVPGVPTGRSSTRRRVVDGFPYVVVFAELESEILIVAVAHGKRLPGYWRHRLAGHPRTGV